MLDTTLMNSLADYWFDEGNGVSFYFSEAHPQNLAHGTGVITAKELVRNIGRKDSSPELRNIIERLEQKANDLRTASAAGLAIFAGPSDFWEEIELPYSVQPQASIGNSFILAPLLPGLISVQETVELEGPLVKEGRKEHLLEIIEDAAGRAARNAREAVGPREVIRALEQGEAQTIVIGPHMPVAASVCTACNHIDMGRPSTCSLCSRPGHRFNDLSEILVRRAGRGAFTIQMTETEEVIPETQGFIAKLRFSADRSTTQVA